MDKDDCRRFESIEITHTTYITDNLCRSIELRKFSSVNLLSVTTGFPIKTEPCNTTTNP